MDRKTRHDIKHDKFLDELGRAYDMAADHRRTLIIGAVILAVLVVAVAGYSAWQSSQEDDAQLMLAEAIETMSAPVGSEAEGAEESYETEQERTAAAKEKFQELVAQHGRSDAAEVAKLYLARIAASEGDAETALATFSSFADEHEENILGLVAEWSAYNIRLTNGEADEVIAELETQVGDPNARKLPLPTVLAMLARAYETMGNEEEAQKNWRRITTEFNDSPYALEANRKLVQG